MNAILNESDDGMPLSSSLRLLSSVPQSIGRFSHIEELELIAVGASLPLEIGNLRNLKLLRIIECPTLLNSNEFCKFELTKLERLELHCCFQDNPIFSLPRYIWKLNNLRSLFIYALQDTIPSLPDATGDLVNLESLEIYNPKLSSISSNIGKLKHLKRLRLSCPKLQHLPSEIGNLHRLEVADFEMCSNLRATDFLSEATALQSSLKVIRITHNLQLRNSSSAPFQQTAYLAKLCQFLAKCKELEVVDLKGNEISNLDGFEALTRSRLGTTSRLRLINFTENPIIYHSLSEEDKDRLLQLLRVHPGLGSFGGDGKAIDKVVDAIILRSWAFPHADHWQQINRVGRSLIMNPDPDQSSIALSIWPTVFARANHVFSKYRAKKRTANAIFYLLRNNPELLITLGMTKR